MDADANGTGFAYLVLASLSFAVHRDRCLRTSFLRLNSLMHVEKNASGARSLAFLPGAVDAERTSDSSGGRREHYRTFEHLGEQIVVDAGGPAVNPLESRRLRELVGIDRAGDGLVGGLGGGASTYSLCVT